ncbi:MAG: T9SS type A sorting domain-containing protein [Flavobacteriales bacterium]|nr:T9SS type A sorting domain-containing protein [Flavobacteriales bacterium]
MKNKSLTKIALSIIGCALMSQSFAQGWIGDSGSNSLYGVNSGLGLSPLSVGIGTSTPSAQFHTTGSVRFQGLTTSLENQVLVADASGNITLRPASSIGTTNAWLLNGNATTGTEFIGTLGADDFRIRTNNLQKMVVTSAGRVGIGQTATAPTKAVDMRYAENLAYSPTQWNRDGLFIYNDFASTGTDQAATITLAARGGANSSMARALISGVVTASNRMDISFQNEYAGSASVRETMRITSDGYVGINVPAASILRYLHVDANNLPIRFENLPSGVGKPLVIDVNGDIYVGAAAKSNSQLQEEVNELRDELRELKDLLGVQVESEPNSWLKQNYPNPGANVMIEYYVHDFGTDAYIIVLDMNGKTIIKEMIDHSGNGELIISTMDTPSGIYQYALVIDGEVVDTKKMILNKE